MSEKIKELIKRRRLQVLVHSCIYYRFGTSIIDDYLFDKWAYELVKLQEDNPEIAVECPYQEAFEGFDGSTGYNLPLGRPWVVNKAYRLIESHNNRSFIQKITDNMRDFTEEEAENYGDSLDEMFKGTGRNLFNLEG